MPKLFTSESVSSGHPDKLADSISDSILDALLEKDSNARSAVETLVSGNRVIVAGEIRANHIPDIEAIARQRILDVGYDHPAKSFDGSTCEITVMVNPQSPDIANGVDVSYETREHSALDRYDELGAGDQGLVFGGAVNENSDYMPTAVLLANRLIKKLEQFHKERNELERRFPLYPDAKAQVTIAYEGNVPVAVETIVLSTQHAEEVNLHWLREFIVRSLITPVLRDYNTEREEMGMEPLDTSRTKYLVNPTGRFVIGGPLGDAGLTGRKIVVDTYGGYFRHGGGAFSGKDYTKVDRSAAYAARWTAKNLVAAGYAEKIEVQIAYAIGVARPVSISVESFGTGIIPDREISEIVEEVFDLRPLAIREALDLSNQKYLPTATGGHFGRSEEGSFSWENLDKIEELKGKLAEIVDVSRLE